jgi:hypothetical protein
MKGRPRRTPPAPAAGTAPAAGAGLFPEASREARQLAAAILEVLAGAQAPGDAARALGLSLARYYQLERRALAGLVAACENRRRKGRVPPGGELAALRRECERLRRECHRHQALVRAARRAVGLAPAPPPEPPAEGRPRRKRRPTARALRMAALLQPEAGGPTDNPPPAVVVPETRPEAAPEHTSSPASETGRD